MKCPCDERQATKYTWDEMAGNEVYQWGICGDEMAVTKWQRRTGSNETSCFGRCCLEVRFELPHGSNECSLTGFVEGRIKMSLRRVTTSIMWTHSFSDEILLQADHPTIFNSDTHEPPVLEPASGPELALSPASNLPIGDLAIVSPAQEREKGKPCSGTWFSQEPGNLHADSLPNSTVELWSVASWMILLHVRPLGYVTVPAATSSQLQIEVMRATVPTRRKV